MSEPSDRALIEAAIAAQEQLRGTLGDDIVDATIAALRAELAPSDPSIEHERRLVTVLFMDVVDSTRTLRDVDPEDTMTIMDAALHTLAEPVAAHGGRVTRFMGDGFLAIFGLRRTRENDAEMAVRAGLGILESARSVAEEVAHRYRITGFQVRVGINTGLVVTGGVTEAEDTVMGSTVNLASRIEGAAPPGGLLISQSTYRQIRGRFDVEPAGTIDAKGFPEPVPVHLVTGERSAGSTQATRGIDDLDIEMVGRRAELDTLMRTLEEVIAGETRSIVTIVGEAGIGKSRLVTEFESHLPARVTTFRARGSLENTDIPYSLLRNLVERRFGIRSDDSPAVVREKLAGLGAHLAPGSGQAAKIDTIAHLLGYDLGADQPPDEVSLSPQQLRDRAVAHFIEFFQGAASNPVVLLLDDLQWSDDSSLAVLREVNEELGTCPVLTIALTRPVLWDTHAEWKQIPDHLLVRLEPLSAEESEVLIDSILSKVEECPPELRTLLLEHAEGNPFYLEELVMMCIDDGVIVADDPVWSVHMDRLATLRVPTTLTGVVRARLDGLSTSEHTALQQASVVGRVFWTDAVAKIAATSGTDPIDAGLGSLEERQMIHLRPTSAFSHTSEYAFSNSVLRDTTYDEVLLSARRRYHGIVADWLIAASGDREHEFAGLIAGHLEKAGRPEALDYLERAGDAAWDSYAVTAAADLYDRALALTSDEDPERRYRLLLAREKAADLTGDRDEQRRRLDELERITDRIGDRVKQSLVAVERSFFGFNTSDYGAALASARLAAEHAEATDDASLQSRVQDTLAWAFVYLEEWDSARSHGERALDLARSADYAEGQGTAQNVLGMVALSQGELSEARRRLNSALEIARNGAEPDAVAKYRNNLAVVLTMLGDYPGADQQFSEILHEAAEGGNRYSEASAHLNLAWVASARGAWEVARTQAEQGIAMKRRQEHGEAVAEGLLWLGHALVGLGELDEAEDAYEASLAIRRELDQTALGLAAEAGLTRVAIARGDIAGAMAHAEIILDHLDRGENMEGTWEPLRIHLTVFEALHAAGDDRSTRVLRRAHRLLVEGSKKITEPDDRRSYLEAIPWHRSIQELAPHAPD